MQITDYKILYETSQEKLAEQINVLIKEWYQPYWFLSVQGEYQYTSYIQVVVKYK